MSVALDHVIAGSEGKPVDAATRKMIQRIIICKEIRTAMIDRGWTPDTLGRFARINSTDVLEKLQNGNVFPSKEDLNTLLFALGIRLDSIFQLKPLTAEDVDKWGGPTRTGFGAGGSGPSQAAIARLRIRLQALDELYEDDDETEEAIDPESSQD